MKLNTERLLLREATLNDAGFIFKLLNQDSFKKNIADKSIKTHKDAEHYIETAFLTPYKLDTFSPYIVCLKSNDKDFRQIGVCGLYKRPALHYPDIGYAFLDQFTGFGYALEAARCVIDYSLNTLGLKYLCALTDPENRASTNLLKKCKFNFETQVILNEEQGVSNLYQLTLK
ncbi:GNAT family N-acetyltransferase [Pseudoalteromonas phenolica]|uniref:GNAT family N-acetyltransferase n=1 Tax=Pseudoalteromonas phenolica TaxID=161398 RepID=UPI001F0E3355|nr:GNAT family N-acetyltransferase [Pseudoalteromonas phenolica]